MKLGRINVFFAEAADKDALSSISCNPVRNWNVFCKLFMFYYNRCGGVYVKSMLSGHVYGEKSKVLYAVMYEQSAGV